MQLNQIKSKIKKKNKKRVGRGGKRGTYSGKGLKGQKSRAGRRIRPQMRDVMKKIPKRRGYRFHSFKKSVAAINIGALERKFSDNEKVTPKTLFEKDILKKEKGILPKVKLLGSGEITKKLLVAECQISAPARKKIEKAGGKIE